MTSQTLDLEQHITSPPEVDAERLQRLNAKLEELAKGGFVVEELPRAQLAHQAAVYTFPKLEMSFLTHSNEKRDRWSGDNPLTFTIRVPRFGVYRLDNPRMSIEVEYKGFLEGFIFRVVEPAPFPDFMGKPIALSTGFSIESQLVNREAESEYVGYFDQKELRRTYKALGVLGINSTLHVLIPTETRGLIREAEKIFGREIYLVAETPPSAWSVRRVAPPRSIVDPILVGVVNNEAFYLDRFNTTPMEEYVAKEFTSP